MSGTGDAGFMSYPPVLTVVEGRTHCEACSAELHPDVVHKCDGNEEYKPPIVTETHYTISARTARKLGCWDKVCSLFGLDPLAPTQDGVDMVTLPIEKAREWGLV